jgi:hypothetical protein
MITFFTNYLARTLCLAVVLACAAGTSFAQIYAPEGLNMPGDWNSWGNPPATGSPLGNEFQVSGGGLKKLTDGLTRWKTTFTGLSGGQFLFTSGPSAQPWNNKWNETTIVMNTLQNYTFQGGGANNSITCNPAKHYTMVWKDNGYSNTQAIFMETSAAPITVSSTSQNPTAGNITPSDAVDVTITLSGAKSSEEIVYLRYTTDNYATSSMLTATGSGTSYSTTIPAQADGITVQYYAMTSTVSGITADHDMYTLSKSTTKSYTSASLPPVNISFRVDMQNELVSGSGVYVAGSFNGFNPTANPLTLISGTTYGATIALAQGSNIEYKFINGSGWESGLSGGCVNGSGNRVYTVGSSDATIASTCFGKCNNCVAKVATTFRVNMNGLTVSTNGMSIAGDFGSTYPPWAPGSIILFNEGNGIYSTTLQLVPGQVVPFKFINGNAWGQDEGVPGSCNVGGNRSYTVPAGASSTPVVCFGTCGTCITVTFQVDMTGQTVSPNGVHIAGAFQGWNPSTTQLSNVGGNVYARTVLVDPNQVSDYKFINGNSWGSDESVANVCSPGSNGNRNFVMGSSSKTLPVVCFRQCMSCTSDMNWLGNNSNFADGNNWTSGWAPTSGSRSVSINATANNPVITTGNFSLGNLFLNNGSSITVNSGSTLSVSGNLSGNYASILGAGTVSLNGAAAQSIGGKISVRDAASTLLINNAAGVSLNAGGSLSIFGALKLQNGNFNASSGNLTIAADASSQGRILKVESGASITGNVTYQKHLAGLGSTASGAWYYVTPTTSGFTMGGFDQGGNNLHPATFLPSNPDPGSLYYYSNSGGTFDDFGWAKASSESQTISTGQGIRVWARKVTSNSLFNYTGAIVGGSISLPVSYCPSGCSYPSNGSANGWNMVGNSFPCTIDWNAASGWTKTGISGNAIAIWNAATESYSTYNGTIGLNGGSRHIAGGQAFFINASSGSSALSMNEDVKADVNSSGLRVASQEINGLKVTAVSGNRRDEAFLDITPSIENGSAPKLDNPGITLSLGHNNRYSIAFLSAVEEGGIIPLDLRRAGNEFQFEIEKVGSQWLSAQVYLKDDLNSQLLPVVDGMNSFSFTAGINDVNRFSLIITDGVTSAAGKLASGVSIYPNPSSGQVVLRNEAGLKGNFMVTDLSGKTVFSGKLDGVNQPLDLKSLSSGQYLIRFESNPEVIRFSKF